ncbi:hypothetical protein CVT24_010185 [Panaeolus cyanescens]|uniref:P-loop containing nucleoside triphosphate hydrolase protein n=1 Tax=Panaeolus cyanescens TaxID=181874 RepID=A0A409YPX0_9AGAR|nr:hypothetical protein CVT24_010185 [Panaeolus cyanescens]
MYLGNLYMKVQMSVKREMSNARSPLLAHFGAAINGLTSIRAYGAQEAFKKESLSRIDHYTRIAKTSFNLNRWAGLRLEILGNIFTAGLAAYLLAQRTTSAANTGFSLVHLERIQAYIDIDHEPPSTESGEPPAAWPRSGTLTVEKLSAKYSPDGPNVLRDISFHVETGERIGIVGRTGSGKSSVTLALLKCILVEGNVIYDGLPVDQINLDALRTSITIIPQIPELLSGTLRRNLDPFEQYDDAVLNDALHSSGLFSLQSEMDEGRLTLDSNIASGGGNLSVGQRQIIALARAMVRNSKLLILDEATSAIDHKTDKIIQSTLRTRLGSDVSVLTVAHRLETIMDSDKIMVLDAGRIVEYDSPSTLLRKDGGTFKAMVDGSGDKQALYAAYALQVYPDQNMSLDSAGRFIEQTQDVGWKPFVFRQQFSFSESYNTLCLPLFAVTVSALYLFSIALVRAWRYKKQNLKQAGSEDPDHNSDERLHVHGGATIVAFRSTRLIGSLVLLGVSIYQLVERRKQDGAQSSWRNCSPQLAIAISYIYTSVLAFKAIGAGYWAKIARTQVTLLFFVVFAVYAHRDIWPWLTFTLDPQDAAEGRLLYFKLAVLTVTAVIIPLFIPRQYIPIDPKNPMETPNPEQTASIFSLVVYAFLDPIIFQASRVSHLPWTSLPPLADANQSAYLTKKSFPYLDQFKGHKRRHLFWGLMSVFAFEYLGMMVSLVFNCLADFASPLAINRILAFMESDDTSTFIVKPWFWVGVMFLGPMISSFSWQMYIFLGTKALVLTQGILTQLVFEHSLRVRLKAEVTRPEAPAPTTSDEASSSSENRSGASTPDSSKGKAKEQPKTTPPAPIKKDNVVGKINTLVTEDVDSILGAKDFLMLCVQVPLEVIFSAIFLYRILGWSCFVGFAGTLLLMPVPGKIASNMQKFQRMKMTTTDARVQSVTETVGVLRMVKLFGWEKAVGDTVNEKRDQELHWIWKNKMMQRAFEALNTLLPTVTMVATYATYTLIMKKSLTASIVFSSIAVFDKFRSSFYKATHVFGSILKGKVGLERFHTFLRETELLDSFDIESKDIQDLSRPTEAEQDIIGFKNAAFTWSADDIQSGSETPSSRFFKLQIDGLLSFKRNSLNVITGPTGCGKTSILMALLGEMHFTPLSADSWYNLPRSGGVAFAAQESWVQNETIKENILFGSPYDEERYRKVIRQCALTKDLDLFEAGDDTEVGEKGLTLSGGQKARVTLARAVYSPAEIILLDDILAALDVHTAKWVVTECLQGDLLRGRTVILATHNLPLVGPIADFFVSVNINGIAKEAGTSLYSVLESDARLKAEVEQQEQPEEIIEEKVEEGDDGKKKPEGPKADGKLVLAEEIKHGHVALRSYLLYLRGFGGNSPFLFTIFWLSVVLFVNVSQTFSVWFLGFWSSQYDARIPEEVDVWFYLTTYASILIGCIVITFGSDMIFSIGTQRASREISRKLIKSILHSTLRWLDETPAARIIARCTQDIAVIDQGLPLYIEIAGSVITIMLCKLAAPVIFAPIVVVPGLAIAVIGVVLGNIYLKAQMSVKREMSNARSPVLAHFGAAIAGLASIRAYGAQNAFKNESLVRIDKYSVIARASYDLNRWIAIRMDLLGASFTACVASYLLAVRPTSASNIGFALTQALEFCTMILYLVRGWNELEVQANSLERIQGYLDIDHEPEPVESGKPPAAWPTSGALTVDHLSARYSANGPKVLHDLSFHVKSGERVGIVGRTGSGKSSLTLALLRCIFTEGNVYYDGVLTSKLNLDALRSAITIIPQIPELLRGTLRRNLDPFGQYDDAVLNDALQASGLFSLQKDIGEGRLTLDSEIASGGGNLSVGQRQIIALARAIVRNSKLLILDEATSAIDHDTDNAIQTTLRTKLGSDVTVLTIAHRLQTIMDSDKIMVLDAGKIIEYDTPANLLQKEKGVFKDMVEGNSRK